MIEAINRAHAWEMTHDPSVVVLGEDVGVNGGVFRATAGLQEQFGKDRVQDTPLAEGMIAGMCDRHGHPGPAAGRRNPVHGLHLSGPGPDRQPHGAHAQPHARPPDLSRRDPHAARRRHSRARASLRVPGGDVRASRRAARGLPLLARARVRSAAGGDPRSGSGDLSRARAPVPAGEPGSRRRRPGAAARCLLPAA